MANISHSDSTPAFFFWQFLVLVVSALPLFDLGIFFMGLFLIEFGMARLHFV